VRPQVPSPEMQEKKERNDILKKNKREAERGVLNYISISIRSPETSKCTIGYLTLQIQ
jgi:hypothetical protein